MKSSAKLNKPRMFNFYAFSVIFAEMHIYRKAWIFWRQRKKRLEERFSYRQDSPHICHGGSLFPLACSYWSSTQHLMPVVLFPAAVANCSGVKMAIGPERGLFWGKCQQLLDHSYGYVPIDLDVNPLPESLSTISGSFSAAGKSSMKRLHLTSVNRFSGISFILHNNFHISCKEL